MVVDINRYTGFAGNALRYRDCLRPFLSLSLSSVHKERWCVPILSLEERLDRLGKIIVTPGEHANHFATTMRVTPPIIARTSTAGTP